MSLKHPNLAERVWVGEARWAATGHWYTLYSTCQATKKDALYQTEHHPNFDRFDRTRVKKFWREGAQTKEK